MINLISITPQRSMHRKTSNNVDVFNSGPALLGGMVPG
jgi:hypothetical protein